MTRAVLYLRISHDHTGEGLAVDRQREDCERIALDRGWDVVETYVDNSISASKRKVRRPAYEQMVSDYAAGQFDALICYDLDRLTRQPRQLEDWIDAAEERGLRLVTANGEADLTTDAGRLFARIKASVAKAEVERKSARQTRALLQRAQQGKAPSGVRAMGYELDGTVREDEAVMVRRMFEKFAAGESLLGLARWMGKSDFLPRRSDRWTPSTMHTILTNARYAGRSTYRGVVLSQGRWEALVSEDLFDIVQARLRDPRRVSNRVGTARKYLGSGLFRCVVCNDAVTSNGPRYWCRKNGHLTRAVGPVDAFVEALVVARLSQPEVVAALAHRDDDAVDAWQARAASLRDRLSVIESDYDEGLIDARRYRLASGKVTAELEDVERKRAALVSTATGGLLVGPSPADEYASASVDIRRAVLNVLIESVVLHSSPRGRHEFDPESVTITWAGK